jgi:hypothetical protein
MRPPLNVGTLAGQGTHAHEYERQMDAPGPHRSLRHMRPDWHPPYHGSLCTTWSPADLDAAFVPARVLLSPTTA